jgi:hypothetical protein
MNKVVRTIEIEGHEEDVNTIVKMLRHMEYLGNVGASRNILVRVDGDGTGRIKVFTLNDTPTDDEFSTEQIKKETHVVGVYDIG